MLGEGHPDGWFHNVRNYVREDRIIEELLEEKGVVTAVLLKILVRFRRCSLPQCFILSGTRCIFLSNRLLKSRLLSTSGCWREFHTTSWR